MADYSVTFNPNPCFADETVTVDATDTNGGLSSGTNFTVSWTNGAGSFSASGVIGISPATFMPGAGGITDFGYSNSGGFIDPISTTVVVYTRATTYGFTISGGTEINSNGTFRVDATQNGGASTDAFQGETITLGDDHLNTATVATTSHSPNQSVSVQYTALGLHTYTPTNDGTLTDPSPQSVTITMPTLVTAF